MKNNVLLSICIPTFKREEILASLINSIISQQADTSLYEICITDNSETDETKNVIEKDFSQIENLTYKKVDCKGFMNSIEALKLGNGKFLKLHNDYSIFKPDALQQMIETIRLAEKTQAVLFFSLGTLKNEQDIERFSDYDSFMNNIGIQATWSSAFGIWKEDFDVLMASGMIPNYMYPHTSLLHRLTDAETYLVDNRKYVNNVEPKKKGGYNLIDNFVRIYLTMVKEDLLEKTIITSATYDNLEDEILKFCARWYYLVKLHPEKFTFEFTDEDKIVYDRCGDRGLKKYRHYKRLGHVSCAINGVKRRVKRILGR